METRQVWFVGLLVDWFAGWLVSEFIHSFALSLSRLSGRQNNDPSYYLAQVFAGDFHGSGGVEHVQKHGDPLLAAVGFENRPQAGQGAI